MNLQERKVLLELRSLIETAKYEGYSFVDISSEKLLSEIEGVANENIVRRVMMSILLSKDKIIVESSGSDTLMIRYATMR